MKVYQIHTYGGPEGLKLSEVPDVVPDDRFGGQIELIGILAGREVATESLPDCPRSNTWRAVHILERSLSRSGSILDGPLDLTNRLPEVILRPFLSANVA